MNRLIGVITQIQQSGSIVLVDLEVSGQLFSALLIESALLPDWLSVKNRVTIVFKETEVSLAKGLEGKISTRNRMLCKVLQVERGELLSKITLQFQKQTIASAITTRAVDSLQIFVGDEIEALIKANEVSLMS